jgi:hypothetical protein
VLRTSLRRFLLASLALSVMMGQALPNDERAQAQSKANAGQLPWNRALGATDPFSARPATSARKLLINVDESELNHFVDRQPLGSGDEETLVRILYRLPAIQVDDVERLTRGDVTWQQLLDDPRPWRAEFFRLMGRVKGVVRVDLIPEVAARLDFDHYFRVAFELDDAPNPILICSRKVPQAWLAIQPRNERASVHGLFIKVGDAGGPHPQLVFAAQRVAWQPDQIAPELGTTADHVMLGNLGFDIGLLDDVTQTNFREITSQDRECFYQMLSAVGRAEPAELQANATGEFSLTALLSDPRPHHGRFATVRGVARRVTKIRVDDADIRERFHLDHYYQIDLFLQLGDQIIRVDSPKSKHDGPVYHGTFPVTVCALRLPPDLPESLNPRREVRVPAFFFKVWSYKSEFVTGVEKGQLQRSPMFIALEPIVLPQKQISNPAGYVAVIALVVTASAFWFGVYWQSRHKRRRKEPGLKDLDIRFPDKEQSV